MKSVQKYPYFFPYLIYTVSFVLYLVTANPSIPPAGNSGELVITTHTFAIPHTTGYPAYTIVSAPFVKYLPLGNVVYRSSLFSGLFTAMMAGFMFTFFTRITRGATIVPVLGTISLIVINTVWAQSVLPEIYSFHLFLLVLALLVSERLVNHFDQRHLFCLSFLCGIALTNHLLFAFMIPFLFIVLIRHVQWGKLKVFPLLLFLALGLSINLYLPIRSALNPVLDWGNPETATLFLNHITGSQFHTSMFALPPSVILHNLSRLIHWMVSEGPIVFILTGLIFSFHNRRRMYTVAAFITCALLTFAIANYDIPDIENYYVTVLVFLMVPAVMGIQRVMDTIFGRHRMAAFFLPCCSSLLT